DGSRGVELWKSDGTAKGTVLLKDINPGSGSPWPGGPTQPNSSYPMNLTAFQGAVYFSAGDAAHGVELWKSDGTAKGTVLLKGIWGGASAPLEGVPALPNSGYPSSFTVFQGALYFAATDAQHGTELWVTDGTAAGTRLAEEITPGPGSGLVGSF